MEKSTFQRPRRLTLYLEKSPSVKTLMEALAKAQLEFTPIVKDATADVIRNGKRQQFKYATLDSVLRSTKPHLLKQGIVMRSDFVVNDEGVTLVTSLTKGDEYICSTLPVRVYEDDERMAAHCTKMQRVAIKGILCVASEEEAPDEEETPEPEKVADAPPPAAMWRQQADLAKNAISEAKTAAQLDDIVAKIKAKITNGDMDPHDLGRLEDLAVTRRAALLNARAKAKPQEVQA